MPTSLSSWSTTGRALIRLRWSRSTSSGPAGLDGGCRPLREPPALTMAADHPGTGDPQAAGRQPLRTSSAAGSRRGWDVRPVLLDPGGVRLDMKGSGPACPLSPGHPYEEAAAMVDLHTRYLGLELRSPLVASASPLTGSLDDLRRLEKAGAGAVVLPSLFQEQLTQEAKVLEQVAGGRFGDRASQWSLARLHRYNTGPDGYLTLIAQAKANLDIPVIASLNAVDPGTWVQYAPLLEEAGADAVELNIYFVATHLGLPGLQIAATLELSDPAELRLPLRWIGILHGQLPVSLAASSGIHSGLHAVKALLAGADVAMTTSALLRIGPEHLAAMETELRQWLDHHGYKSVAEIRGAASRRAAADPAAYERANYIRTLITISPSHRSG